MTNRVALLGIYHESNTFLKSVTTLTDFEKGHWLWGNDIRAEYQDAYHEIGGMLEVLDEENIEVLPVMFAEATPGGIISANAFDTLLKGMLDRLDSLLPVDGCMVVPHGAAVSQYHRDMDGYWLKRLREKVGPDTPVIGTLDPHANVSELMIASTNALIAYKTNPHIDQRQTGKRAAKLMIRVLKEDTRLKQILRKPPLAISIEQQWTERDPCKHLFSYTQNLARTKRMLSVSVCLGFPYADVEEMGTAVIVISENDEQSGLEVGKRIESYMLKYKDQFVGDKKNIHQLINGIGSLVKPVLLLDMGDNVGGGAPGDSIYLLEEIEKYNRYHFFICLHGPDVVLQARRKMQGEQFEIKLKREDPVNRSLTVRVSLLQFINNGRFCESEPRHGGQVTFDMGKTAIVRTERGNTIMFTSFRIAPFSLKQLTSFGINPKEYDILIAKGVNAPIAAFTPVCPTIIQVDTPGDTKADMTLFDYKYRIKPLFPFEKDYR